MLADFGRHVLGYRKAERQVANQVHAVDPQEVDQDGRIQNDCWPPRSDGHTTSARSLG
jgi:hypothetical protein